MPSCFYILFLSNLKNINAYSRDKCFVSQAFCLAVTKPKCEPIVCLCKEKCALFSAFEIYCIVCFDRWTVHATMEPKLCTAIVDFNVPGKSNPPPVKLLATVCTQSRFLPAGTIKKRTIEWTDPSGKLAPPSVPLNTWLQLEDVPAPKSCIQGSPLVFKDLNDGDSKLVTLSGNRLSITPIGTDARL